MFKGDVEQRNILAPIETYYNGYRFRSRLEGRWAVFFDSIGLKFQYESEGWKLPSGIWYLPDFFLPESRTWAEVKPTEFTADEIRKCREVAMGNHRLMLLLVGPPDFRDYEGIANDSGILDRSTYRLDPFFYGPRKDGHLWSDPGDPISEKICSTYFRDAVYASRAARFDGSDYPIHGLEPFNPNPWEMGF